MTAKEKVTVEDLNEIARDMARKNETREKEEAQRHLDEVINWFFDQFIELEGMFDNYGLPVSGLCSLLDNEVARARERGHPGSKMDGDLMGSLWECRNQGAYPFYIPVGPLRILVEFSAGTWRIMPTTRRMYPRSGGNIIPKIQVYAGLAWTEMPETGEMVPMYKYTNRPVTDDDVMGAWADCIDLWDQRHDQRQAMIDAQEEAQRIKAQQEGEQAPAAVEIADDPEAVAFRTMLALERIAVALDNTMERIASAQDCNVWSREH